MRLTERSERDVQLALSDANGPGGDEDYVQQRSAFLVGTGVVRPHEGQQVAFRVVNHYFDEISQVFALGGELDHRVHIDIADGDAMGNVATFVEELGQPSTGRAQLFAQVASAISLT